MSRLRPSSADRWVHCAGSVSMQEQFPEPTNNENEAAREGTAAHYVLESRLHNEPIKPGNVAPNGVVITEEMIDSSELVILDIIATCGLNHFQSEKFIKIPRIHPTECAGTSDVVVYHDKKQNELVIWDLKYGFGIVDVYENWQLLCYAIGNLDEITGGNGLADQQITVKMRIVQPRVYHPDGVVREWSVNGADLRNYVNILNNAGANALGDDPLCVSGPWCKHCTARADCQTNHHASMNAIDVTQSMKIETIPNDYLATHRAILLKAKASIDNRLTGIDAQIIATLKKPNQLVRGLALDNPPGNLKWTRPDGEILALGTLMNVTLSKTVLMTPTQAGKVVDESVIKPYTNRPPGKTKIVSSTNSKAARVFGNVS